MSKNIIFFGEADYSLDPSDIDVKGLLVKLRDNKNPLSTYLVSSRSAIKNLPEDFDSSQVAFDLAEELNKIICGPPIYNKEFFNKINLSDRTKMLLHQIKDKKVVHDEDVYYLNRFLLEDVFSTSINVYKKSVTPALSGSVSAILKALFGELNARILKYSNLI